jgi:hypothetical protein
VRCRSHACSQHAFAVGRWRGRSLYPFAEMSKRYHVTT